MDNMIPGLDPKTATKQQVFDFVAFKLIQQGKPAMVDGSCRYRTAEGYKCAAGHLLPDAEYLDSLEEKNVSVVIGQSFSVRLLNDAVGFQFLTDLQRAHDKAAQDDTGEWLAAWRGRMRVLAKNNHLDASILTWKEGVQ